MFSLVCMVCISQVALLYTLVVGGQPAPKTNPLCFKNLFDATVQNPAGIFVNKKWD